MTSYSDGKWKYEKYPPLKPCYRKCVDIEETSMVRANICIDCQGTLVDIEDGHKKCTKCGEIY